MHLSTILLLNVIIIRFTIMLKLQQRQMPAEYHTVKNLLKRIRAKLSVLGFSQQEIQLQMLNNINRVFKIKSKDPRQTTKIILGKLHSERCCKKMAFQLTVELDLFLNSIYDNYDSDSEEKNLKIQTPLHKGTAQKEINSSSRVNQEVMSQGNSQGSKILERYLSRRTSLFEGSRVRRMFEKYGRVKEVKLEYIKDSDQM